MAHLRHAAKLRNPRLEAGAQACAPAACESEQPVAVGEAPCVGAQVGPRAKSAFVFLPVGFGERAPILDGLTRDGRQDFSGSTAVAALAVIQIGHQTELQLTLDWNLHRHADRWHQQAAEVSPVRGHHAVTEFSIGPGGLSPARSKKLVDSLQGISGRIRGALL